MSELMHPRIEFDIQSEDSSELAIVNDLVAILKLRQRRMQYFVDNLEVNTAVTETVEMYSLVEEIGIGMRITRTPVLTTSRPLEGGELYPSSSYLVLSVEFGEIDVDEAEEAGYDPAYEWHPYITAIVDRKDSEHPEIVQTQSGKNLTDLELMQAGSIVEQMKKETIAYALSDELVFDEAEPFYQRLDPLNATAVTAVELIDRIYGPNACRHCIDAKTVCYHPQAN